MNARPTEIVAREALSPGVQRALATIFPARTPAVPPTPTTRSAGDDEGTPPLRRVAEERAPYTPHETPAAPETPDETK